MRISRLIAPLVVVALLACGGGNSGNGNPTGLPTGGATNGTFSATIGGASWHAIGQVAVTRQGNLIGLAGTGSGGSVTYALVLTIGNATGPGTHSLNAANDGSNLVIGSSTTAGWSTGFSGGTGTVTITSLTANRIVGTFSGTAVPSQGSTSNLVITSGTFDITF